MAADTTGHPAGDDWSLEEYPKQSEVAGIRKTPPPTRIGRYVIEDSLGHGGMGIVYLAEHLFTKQKVALKVIIPQQANPDTIQDFLREIRLLARLIHPQIAAIFDADTFESDQGPRPYYTMQFIEGAKAVTDYSRDTRCSYERRLELILQAASAVAAAHRKDVIHGDIKPRNALVGLDGDLRVVDFGAAIDAASPEARLRALSPIYAAPEQTRELRVVKQSDVYSLAVLACEVLTGRLPFADSEVGGQRGPPIPIRQFDSKVSVKIERVLSHALSERPEERYSDAEAFRRDLAAAARGGLLQIEAPTYWNRTRAFCAEHRGPVLAAAAVIAALLVGIVGTTWQSLEARKQAGEAMRASARAEALAKAETVAREHAQLSEQREREAHLRTADLKRSTDNAMAFVPRLLFSIDSYNVHDRTLNVELLLDAANTQLSGLAGDKRLSAIAHAALGRIASNWGQYERGSRWLDHSAQLWRQIAQNKDSAPEEQRDALYQESQALNHMAWALLGDARKKEGLPDRATRAEKAAQEAFLVRKRLSGAMSEDTLCLQADWLRMRLLTGRSLEQFQAAMEFVDLMAAMAGRDSASFIGALRTALRDAAKLASDERMPESKQRAREFLAPFLSRERPRLRSRLPWSLAQANEELASLPLLFRSILGLSDSQISALRIPMAELALELAEEIHPGDRLSVEQVRRAQERAKASNSAPR